jgi:hypothetical protein
MTFCVVARQQTTSDGEVHFFINCIFGIGSLMAPASLMPTEGPFAQSCAEIREA